MKKFIFLIIFILISHCNKQKVVLICGDHICINKKEANQFFEENLTLEVKIIDKNKKDKLDLIQLNLNDSKEKKIITLLKKNNTNKKLKTLSKNEITQIKQRLKSKENKKKEINIIKKINIDDNKKIKNTIIKKKEKSKKNKNTKIDKFSVKNEIVDVCTIVKNCNIDEISKYLINMSQKKNYPDITMRK